MDDQKSVEQIVHEAHKAVTRVINNNIGSPTCPEKKLKAEWKREKVVNDLIVKLGPVGPTQTK